MKKNQMSCQSVKNSLCIDEFPPELRDIRRLERVLISRRILFKKIVIMSKGQSPKLKGSICNVPIDVEDIANTPPRQINNNGIVIVKIKRKLEYKAHVLFEPIRSNFIQQLLCYLKDNNPLYHDIEIDFSNICSSLILDKNESTENLDDNSDKTVDFNITAKPDIFDIVINSNSLDEPIPIVLERNDDDEFETTVNPLDAFRSTADETALMSHMPSEVELDNEILILAPGQGKTPMSVL